MKYKSINEKHMIPKPLKILEKRVIDKHKTDQEKENLVQAGDNNQGNF